MHSVIRRDLKRYDIIFPLSIRHFPLLFQTRELPTHTEKKLAYSSSLSNDSRTIECLRSKS